jgi:hypothetical protein
MFKGATVSAQLDKAKQQAEAGKLKAALDSIRYAVPGAVSSGDLEDAHAIIALVDQISSTSDKRLAADCAEIRKLMEAVIVRESAPALVLQRTAFASLGGCRLIACAGLDARPSASKEWTLGFTDDRVILMPTNAAEPEEAFDLDWQGLEVEIEGAGEVTSGGGFFGGGFGLQGAAVGMLAASALNALTTSSHMDTVVHLQTPNVKAYLLYGEMTPVALRRTLAPVFLRLRQESSAASTAGSGGDHVVDRLHKLADLLDRDLITQEEFERLKGDLMGQLP